MTLNKKDKQILKKLGIPYKLSSKAGQAYHKNLNISTSDFQKHLKEQATKNREIILKNDEKSKKNRKAQRKFQFLNESKPSQFRKRVETLGRQWKGSSTIQKTFIRNKLNKMKPSNSAWSSYYEYTIENTRPHLVPMPNLTPANDLLDLFKSNKKEKYITITETDVENFLKFYKVKQFLLKTLKNYELFKSIVTFNFYDNSDVGLKSLDMTSKAMTIKDETDINNHIENILKMYDKISSQSYTEIVKLEFMKIHISKINLMKGGTYIELPPKLKNKKAMINIKNTDNLCLLYSILCGLKTPKEHAERVSHYTNRLKELKYDNITFPFELKDAYKFETMNKIRLNIFTNDDNNYVVPCYNTKQRSETSYPLINIFLYVCPKTNQKHYLYIKDLNRLFNSKQSNKIICPLCCEFSCGSNKDGKAALEKHMEGCIAGQRVRMPNLESNILKFKNYSNTMPLPIRVYADFETYMDKMMRHLSKNEKTEFNCCHKPNSYKLRVVSDIPLSLQNCYRVGDYYTYFKVYKGTDADKDFVKTMEELEKIMINDIYNAIDKNTPKSMRLDKLKKRITKLEKQLEKSKSDELSLLVDTKIKNLQKIKSRIEREKEKDVIIMTEEQKEQHKNQLVCGCCNSNFTDDNKKVRHHNHYTGEFIETLCNNCNIQIKEKIQIPVIFHNLNYDKNVFFKSFVHREKMEEISILPENSNNFKSFKVGNLNFIDSFKFMSSGLSKLIDNIPDTNKLFLKNLADSDDVFDFIKSKGFFPYDWFDDPDKMNMKITELKKEHFDNKLTNSKLSDDDWNHIQRMIKLLKIKTFEEFHDFYLHIDVDGLTDVFESFRKQSLKYYNLEPCYYVGTPSFAWDAMLLRTKIELELITDVEMYVFFEKGIRGGQSVVFNKYCKANNKYLSNYNKDLPSIFISYLDANNLYGKSMSEKLPYKNFQWCNDMTYEKIVNYQNNKIGYVLEVDLHYPKDLHDEHNDYPLAPEQFMCGKQKKLCGTFKDKNKYVVDIRNLQFYLKQGMILKKIHRCVKFEQKEWLSEWINMNTNFRKEAKNDFEKDYFKLMNNAVFGKTMENVRDRVDIKTAFTEDTFLKYSSKGTFKRAHLMNDKEDEKFMLMEMGKKQVILNKPIYAGFCILDLSKLHMYKFHYEIMKPKYGFNYELMYQDTDSFIYRIHTDDFYKDMKEMEEHFDMSDYSKTNPFYDEKNKKVIGKFKDESKDLILSEYVAYRSKCKFLKHEKPLFWDNLDVKLQKSYENHLIEKTLKGVPKVVVKDTISFENVVDCVNDRLTEEQKSRNVINIRTKMMSNYTTISTKKALDNNDDKRIWNGFNSKAYGHYTL